MRKRRPREAKWLTQSGSTFNAHARTPGDGCYSNLLKLMCVVGGPKLGSPDSKCPSPAWCGSQPPWGPSGTRSCQTQRPPSLRNASSAWTLARPRLGSASTATRSRPPQAYSRWGSRHPRPLRFTGCAAVTGEAVGAQGRLMLGGSWCWAEGMMASLPCPRTSALRDMGNQQNTSLASPPRCD